MTSRLSLLSCCFRLGVLIAATAQVGRGQIIGGGGSGPQPQPSPTPTNNRPAPAAASSADPAVGDRLVAEGKFAEAARVYSEAIRRSAGNAPLSLYLRLGDAQNALAGDDIFHAMAARQAWETAMKQYPQSIEPRQRLMRFYVEYADISNTDTRLDLLRRAATVAGQVLAVDPSDDFAVLVQQRGTIEPFLYEKTANAGEVSVAIEALRDLQTRRPEDVDIPFIIARAQGKLGTNALKFGNRDEAAAQIKAAIETMDQAIARQPKSAGLLFRKAQMIQSMGLAAYDINAFSDDRAAAAARDKMGREMADLLGGAVGLLNEKDPELNQIVSFAVRVQRGVGNDALAESILRTIIGAQPKASSPRVQLAEILIEDPARYEEALAILVPAVQPPVSRSGIAGMVAVEAYRSALMTSIDLRIELFNQLRARAKAPDFATANPAEPAAALAAAADKHLQQARADLATLQPRSGEPGPRVLRLNARVQQACGDTARAIQLLNKALPPAREMGEGIYCEILTLLGKAYIESGDTTSARKQFEDAISRIEYAPARIALVQLLIDLKAMPETRPHLEKLKNDLPAAAEVQDLQAQLLQWEGRGDRATVRALLDTMPEESTPHKLNKIGVSSRVGEQDVAMRIIDALAQQFPGESRVTLLRTDVLVRANDRPAAVKLLQDFDAAQPNNPQIRAKLNQLIAPK